MTTWLKCRWCGSPCKAWEVGEDESRPCRECLEEIDRRENDVGEGRESARAEMVNLEVAR